MARIGLWLGQRSTGRGGDLHRPMRGLARRGDRHGRQRTEKRPRAHRLLQTVHGDTLVGPSEGRKAP